MILMNYRSRRASIWILLTNRESGGRREIWMVKKAVCILSFIIFFFFVFSNQHLSRAFKLFTTTNLKTKNKFSILLSLLTFFFSSFVF